MRLLHLANRILCHKLNNDRTVDRKLISKLHRHTQSHKSVDDKNIPLENQLPHVSETRGVPS